MTLILTIIFYIWLFLVLILLYAMWRSGSQQVQRLQKTLVEVALKSAEAALRAADAAYLIAGKNDK